jgi:hypothetical protein
MKPVLSGNRELASFSNIMGAGWSTIASGGGGTRVDVDEAAGKKCPVINTDIPGNNHIISEKRFLAIKPNQQNHGDGKIRIGSGRSAHIKKYANIPEYRHEAEICFQRSELTTDRTAKLRWLTLAEAWHMMADNMAKREGCDANGKLSYQYLQDENEGGLDPFLTSSNGNRRKYPRYRVLKEGKITNSHMHCLANVVIRDLSKSGARVQLPESQIIPDDFGLYVVTERLLYPAVARWREENALGIQFVAEPRITDLQKA